MVSTGTGDGRGLSLSIVVPVYRSAGTLPGLAERVRKEMLRIGLVDDFELILVNDASPDESWAVIRGLSRDLPFVRGIHLRLNSGQHNALMAGLHFVRGRSVVLMDDDLQHPPEAIGDLLRELGEEVDVCYARYDHRADSRLKRLGSWFNDAVATWLLGKPRGLYLSSFKALKREIVAEVVKYDGPFVYLDGLILGVTHAIGTAPVHHHARAAGTTNYSLSRLVSLWLRMATTFSVRPLRVATVAGLAISAASLGMILVILVEKLLRPDLPRGWASLIATTLFMGGVQMFSIGVIGEYLGRTYLKLNGKPQFVVRATTWGRPS
ncbi:MAG TPA: glycosyltransferase family 2 protein [Anaeromyxobacteraceae bacterium]|nr:glycosyltransferase family 2 protein [Anaeromyxobacteraceae bacterium]